VENNPHDSLFAQIGIQQGSSFLSFKLDPMIERLIKSEKLPLGYYLKKNEEIPLNLLKLLRILVMSEDEIYFYKVSVQFSENRKMNKFKTFPMK
jgi:hypothetical protein